MEKMAIYMGLPYSPTMRPIPTSAVLFFSHSTFIHNLFMCVCVCVCVYIYIYIYIYIILVCFVLCYIPVLRTVHDM